MQRIFVIKCKTRRRRRFCCCCRSCRRRRRCRRRSCCQRFTLRCKNKKKAWSAVGREGRGSCKLSPCARQRGKYTASAELSQSGLVAQTVGSSSDCSSDSDCNVTATSTPKRDASASTSTSTAAAFVACNLFTFLFSICRFCLQQIKASEAA